MIDSKCFSVEQRDDVTILRFADTKDFDTDDYAELQQNLLEFTERQQPAKLLVDLGNVVYCSTALINALLMAQKRIQAWSGTMKLFGVGEVMLETLQRLKLIDKIFSVHADETAASNAS